MQGVPHHECLWTLQLAEPKQPGRNRFYQLTQGLATWSSTHINTPHTGCLLTCLSPWWMIWSYLATHGTIPCDVEDSTAHGSKLTHNHQVYRKPTTIWHPGNETCKANVKKKKQNPEVKGWVIEFTTFDDPLRFHHANQGAPHLLGEYPWRRCLKKLHQSLVLGRLLCRLLTYRYL